MVCAVALAQAVVSERLSVRLEPVDLRLQPPTAQEFHDSLQQLFTAGAFTNHSSSARACWPLAAVRCCLSRRLRRSVTRYSGCRQ